MKTFLASGTLGYNFMLFTPTSRALATYYPQKKKTHSIVSLRMLHSNYNNGGLF